MSGKNYRAYTVEENDNLGVVAEKELGFKTRYKDIHDYNKVMVPDQDVVHLGQILNIPID